MPLPAVSCEWNWMCVSPLPAFFRTSRAAFIVSRTVVGVEVPEASLKQRRSNGMPASMICCTREA